MAVRNVMGLWEKRVFKGRHFDASLILLCVRWYLSYGLSNRNLEEMIAERGISVDHSTIHRWVLRYAPKLHNFNRQAAVSQMAYGRDLYQGERPVDVSVSSHR
jgi:transposase-like protein